MNDSSSDTSGSDTAGDGELVVELRDVGRRFGDVIALDQTTIEAPRGAITVLLGPNGAGKTTAIRLITGALGADRGLVRVFGQDPTSTEGENVRRRCGVVSAKPSLYDRLSGLDNLRYAAELYGLGRGPQVDAGAVAAADRFGIAHALDQQVGGYSTGMKTRLALSRALLHDPELLLLDEPTSGLDPESAAAVLELIRTMTSQGRTVLMCTHLLLEAEGLADRVVMMQQGTTIVAGAPPELAREFWPHPIVRFCAESGPDLDLIAAMAGVIDVERAPESTTARVTLDREERTADIVVRLAEQGVRLRAVEPYRPTLEDLYFAVQRQNNPPVQPSPDPIGAGV